MSLRILFLLTAGLALAARGRAEMFPFPIQTLNAEHDATDMSALNQCPAGRSGFVTAKGGHFVDGKGKRIRFLGVNLCFSGAFPDHATAEKVASRLAKLGVNCVRLHHMDGQYGPNGIWDSAFKDKQHISASQLDKLDYLIHQLKLHGVYVDINLHVSRQFGPDDGFPDAGQLTKYDKGVDNFEPRMIQLQKDYARDLLTHVNPYTKTRYADEPAVALIELNNENSLLEYCMNGQIATIPEHYLSQLQAKWVEWLKARYGTTAKLLASWQLDAEPMGDNLLANTDLADGTAHWVLEAPSPAKAEMKVEDGGPTLGVRCLHARLTQPGAEPWHFQVHQIGLDLVDGKPYTVSFWARSDQPREIDLYTGLDIAPWRRVGLSRQVEFTPQWRRFEFTFYPSQTEKKHNRLSFGLRSCVGDVWLAQIKLRRGGGDLPSGAGLESGTIGLPFFSHTARQRADFMDFVAETERKYTSEMHSYLRDTLGVKSLVVDTQGSYGGIGGVYRESLMDYVDMHAYWQHPIFPHKAWDPEDWTVRNTPMVRSLGSDTLTRLAMHRVAGKPFTVSEYNHPAPGDYSAECVPMLAAWAAIQDWDGIFLFDYHSSGDWARGNVSGFFSIDSHPAKIALMPMAANMFRRADVTPISRVAELTMPVSEIATELVRNGQNVQSLWSSLGYASDETLVSRPEIRFSDKAGVKGIRRYGSSGGSAVEWADPENGVSSFIINSPATRGVVGFASEPVRLGGLILEMIGSPAPFAVVMATALDGKPLEKSSHILVSAVGRVENTGMTWNESRTSVGRKWGNSPALAEGVSARLTLNAGVRSAWAYALDGGGGRSKEVPVRAEDGSLTLALGPESRTLWYEVMIGR